MANKFPNTKKNNSEHNVTNQFYPMLKANNTTQISETKAKEINKIKQIKRLFRSTSYASNVHHQHSNGGRR